MTKETPLFSARAEILVESWSYKDVALARQPASTEDDSVLPPPPPGFTSAEVQVQIQAALAQAEEQWAAEARQRDQKRDADFAMLVQAFQAQQARYFRHVEEEVVQLTLAITRKILQREAALDPTLLQGLVRVALDRMASEGKVRIRLAPSCLAAWSQTNEDFNAATTTIELVPDDSLSAECCIIETDRGSAHFGIEEQVKEIEQSFHDLLARRPEAT